MRWRKACKEGNSENQDNFGNLLNWLLQAPNEHLCELQRDLVNNESSRTEKRIELGHTVPLHKCLPKWCSINIQAHQQQTGETRVTSLDQIQQQKLDRFDEQMISIQDSIKGQGKNSKLLEKFKTFEQAIGNLMFISRLGDPLEKHWAVSKLETSLSGLDADYTEGVPMNLEGLMCQESINRAEKLAKALAEISQDVRAIDAMTIAAEHDVEESDCDEVSLKRVDHMATGLKRLRNTFRL